MPAPTNSVGTPRICRPSNLVSSTTTSSGTRQIRETVSAFGRFMTGSSHMITSVVGMKAILLAGGKGTRLRPLTIHTPKPIVPIFERPFLHYQLDLLKRVPEIDEVILSLNYQPRRIEEIFGDGSDLGIGIRYVVEPAPLGTGGAVRYAGDTLRESVVVFNGDVLTEVDLKAVIALHRDRRASKRAQSSRGPASSTRARSSRAARESAPTASSDGSAMSRSTRTSSARSSGRIPGSARTPRFETRFSGGTVTSAEAPCSTRA